MRESWWRSGRTWTIVATTLAVLATVWSTFIGKTIPDLLRNDPAESVLYQRKVDAACAPLPQSVVFMAGPPTGQSQDPPRITVAKLDRAVDQFGHEVSVPVGKAAQRIVAIDLPSAAGPQYLRFQNTWVELATSLKRIYDLRELADFPQATSLDIDDLELVDPAAFRRRLLQAATRADRQARDGVAQASLLRSHVCARAIAEISERITNIVYEFNGHPRDGGAGYYLVPGEKAP